MKGAETILKRNGRTADLITGFRLGLDDQTVCYMLQYRAQIRSTKEKKENFFLFQNIDVRL